MKEWRELSFKAGVGRYGVYRDKHILPTGNGEYIVKIEYTVRRNDDLDTVIYRSLTYRETLSFLTELI